MWRKFGTAYELVVKAHYLRCMKENTKCYWDQKWQQQAIVIQTHTIVHPYNDVMVVKYCHDVPRSVCNRNQPISDLKRLLICLTNSYNEYIID